MKNIRETAYKNDLATLLIQLAQHDMHSLDEANAQKKQNPTLSTKDFVQRTERENSEVFKQILNQLDAWPKISEVGIEASVAAFVIAQHADHDPAFQRKCLNLLEKAALEGEAHPAAVAFLTDRILVNEKQTQLYGTQLHPNVQGMFELQPTDDLATLDARRRMTGLDEDHRSYIKRVNSGDMTPFRELYHLYQPAQHQWAQRMAREAKQTTYSTASLF